MIDSWVIWTTVVMSTCLLYLCQRKRHPLPPGPPTLPIIGNLHQFPSIAAQREVFHEWHQQYGPIVTLKLGPKVLLLLGNHKVASDLLDKRGAWYSDRPRMVMGGECVCRGLNTALRPYDAQWKLHRRLLSAFLNARTAASYESVQDLESKQLLYEMLDTNDFSDRFIRYAGSILFSLAYGRRLTTGHEKEIHEILEVADVFVDSVMSGTWLVDVFPWLNHLPRFLAPWKRIGDEFYERTKDLFEKATQAAMGTDSWNWSKQIQSLKAADGVSAEELSYLVGELFEAGIDTTLGVYEIFVMASVLHPDIVQQAQREIDQVVGAERLPTFEDFRNLPFVDAFIKEVMRWRPTIPSGVPHAATQDDVYEGYHIPRGAIVLPNHWAIHLDEATFPNPMSFQPQRWIDNPDLPLNAFGFGRRACPGNHIAFSSLKLAICRLLWGFHIEHTRVDGRMVEVDSSKLVQKGILLRPEPFQASFRVRDETRRKVVENQWLQSEPTANSIIAAALQPK
ncbi:uncharacterized protein N7459_007318 [Penicillium hispanicum]|uniref:uncharacterized protein n=1 Tax=Penicillium hispanicum TaxID=1080232 RepID=UPI0025414C4E|nr:uncharacterized protein N7459_007318 [Penicillium hispanicum]KAJ5578354.1 hypothetical protein N7459_007318 [Penicillium hispanicum]